MTTLGSTENLLQAILLGIIQGLTEFLPISSTAHLRIVPALLGWQDPGAAFTAVVQIGTLGAVLIYFWSDVVRIGRATLTEALAGTFWQGHDARLGWMMILATVPIGVCGLLLRDWIETTFRSLYIIIAALIGLALLLALAEWLVRRRQQAGLPLKELDQLGWGDALVVGLAQALALVPGSSRSGVTITGGLFLGLSRETAARFSFLMSLPAIFAAGVYQLYKERDALFASSESTVNLAVCTLVSGIVGYLAIAFLLGYLRKHSTAVFIVYRLILGAVILALVLSGQLPAE